MSLKPQSETWSESWEHLRLWFRQIKREFPWRNQASPYAVWVSEVMLQQTRAEVVVPYFLRWMERFPHPRALAEAPWEEVLKHWEGLGYYSRAHRLHEGAKLVVERWGGELPDRAEALAQIPGLGPYTIEAIRAFAFQQRAAPVDGNVLRVWSRLESCGDPIDRPVTQRQARLWLQEALPLKSPHELAEALIELGATLCKPKSPDCGGCPLQRVCRANQEGDPTQYPKKTARKATERITRQVLLWMTPKGLLLERGRCQKQVMGHLWRLPTFASEDDLRRFLRMHDECADCEMVGLSAQRRNAPSPASLVASGSSLNVPVSASFQPHRLAQQQVRHSFVNTVCTLIPWVLCSSTIVTLGSSSNCGAQEFHCVSLDGAQDATTDYEWVCLEDLATRSFPSGYRSLVQLYVKHGPFLAPPDSQHHSLLSSAAQTVHA